MQISRRDLLRSSAAVAAGGAIGGLGLAESAVAARAAAGLTTLDVTLDRTTDAGWRAVVAGEGEAHVVRSALANPKKGRVKRRTHMLTFAQLSDVHVVDSQSPLRLEPYDHKGDPDSDAGEKGTYKSAWRPQEILGVHVADAMVRRINEIERGPVLGKKIALAIQTGDNSDNNQLNEIRWNIDVLDGGVVQVDSGDRTRYEGVMDDDAAFYDTNYWHPDGTPDGLEDDQARTKYGFPEVPGLLDAARAPFDAEGLDVPWLTAMGNHDGMPQGSVTPTGPAENKALGEQKQITLSPNKVRTVTPDPDRELLSKAEWVEEHFNTPESPGPVGHGFTPENRAKGTAYYTFDHGRIRFVVLDSVNPNGRETGSINRAQFAWLKKVLEQSPRRLLIIASHHTTGSMDNTLSSPIENGPRVLGPQILAELLKHDNVIAWVNGHTHTNQIWAHKRKGGGGFWEINTASHIDWPQQARLIEIANNQDGTLSIFTTMIDHAGDVEFSGDLENPVQLAALSRLLSANDWQERDSNHRGQRSGRNTELLVRAPRFLT